MPSINVDFANGSPVDLKIDEKFKESDLVTFLKKYADDKGIGGNILTSKISMLAEKVERKLLLILSIP